MKRLFTICTALAASLLSAQSALAEETGFAAGSLAAYFEDAPAEEPVIEEHDGAAADEAASSLCGEEEAGDCTSDCAEEASCECDDAGCCEEPASGCGDGCGNAGCFCDGWGTLGIDDYFCCCDYGDACKLQSHLTPCCNDVTYGGWFSIGYYTDNDPLSFEDNDLLSFWDNPNELNFDQQWFYIEKLAKGDCSWDVGYRFDLVYGVDTQKTQAFGNSGFPNPQGYDNSWDHGKYGWAAPQAYLQFNKDDLDIKVGHFFTPIGYEVIPKTGNFFYSHSYTMFNSEPFTHTGALATYTASDKVTYYGGWTLGWDTGYDQFGDGNNFLGGAGLQLSDSVKYTYLCTAGDLGWRGDGYSHSNVVDFTLSDKWQYVLQSDLLDSSATDEVDEALSYGVNNYLFYTINDCWKWGTRMEWWKSNQLTGDQTSFYAVTTGLNYQASANLILRPEVKWNWTPADDAVEGVIGEEFNNTIFGMDAIYTF
jgi:Putative beta-barrel porin-2, OmpL-like. bbp2